MTLTSQDCLKCPKAWYKRIFVSAGDIEKGNKQWLSLQWQAALLSHGCRAPQSYILMLTCKKTAAKQNLQQNIVPYLFIQLSSYKALQNASHQYVSRGKDPKGTLSRMNQVIKLQNTSSHSLNVDNQTTK